MRADEDPVAQAPPDEPAVAPTPRPGRPVRGSSTGRPLSALFDLLGRRWALTVIWTLRDGPMTFRALQAQTEGIAASVLNTRLRELREAGIVQHGGEGFALTEIGTELLRAGEPLVAWADVWADQLNQDA